MELLPRTARWRWDKIKILFMVHVLNLKLIFTKYLCAKHTDCFLFAGSSLAFSMSALAAQLCLVSMFSSSPSPLSTLYLFHSIHVIRNLCEIHKYLLFRKMTWTWHKKNCNEAGTSAFWNCFYKCWWFQGCKIIWEKKKSPVSSPLTEDLLLFKVTDSLSQIL